MAYRVIVADKSYSVKKAVRMALSESEFEVFPFDDGREVLEQLSEINPDVILLSLSLSLKNIDELHKQLQSQSQFQKTSLILLRGIFDPLEEEKISELDYDQIVQVPFASQRLERVIRDLVEKKNDPQTLPEEPFLEELPDEGVTDRLEERIRARLIPEMKTWLLKELEEIKKSLRSKE